MIITFCGHSNFSPTQDLEAKILNVLAEKANGQAVTFYLGGYGAFDSFARDCAEKYKKRYGNATLLFVSPYLNESYLKDQDVRLIHYDGSIYPEIEGTPSKYAILKRNEWMVKNADLLIAFVEHGWGGAAKMLDCAVRWGVPFVNFGSQDPEK